MTYKVQGLIEWMAVNKRTENAMAKKALAAMFVAVRNDTNVIRKA